MNDDSPGEDAGWNSYRRMVVAELERLSAMMKDVKGSVDELKQDVGTIKVKAAILGTALGSIFGAVVSWLIGKRA